MTTAYHTHIHAILSTLHDRVSHLENLGFFLPSGEYPVEYQNNEALHEIVVWYLSEVRMRFGNRRLQGGLPYADIIDEFNADTRQDNKRQIKSHLYGFFHEVMYRARDTDEFSANSVDDVMNTMRMYMNMMADL